MIRRSTVPAGWPNWTTRSESTILDGGEAPLVLEPVSEHGDEAAAEQAAWWP